MASTNGLTKTLQIQAKCTLADMMWGPTSRNHNLDTYWAFYEKHCERSLHDEGRHIQCRTHKDIFDIVTLLKAGRTRSEIRDVLQAKFTKQHANELYLLDNSINLAANVLLMVDFADDPYRFSGAHRLCWERGSLRDCLMNHFSSSPTLGHEATKLPRMFNASSLGRIARVHVVPTNNLLDHLRLVDDDSKLLVFHNASFLKRQTRSEYVRGCQRRRTVLTSVDQCYQQPWFRKRSRLSLFSSLQTTHL